MPNFVKYLGIGMLATLLAACDDAKNTAAPAQGETPAAEAPAATGQKVELLSGKVSFTLPADMTDQSGKLGTQANNMHVYANPSGQMAAIAIVSDNIPQALPALAQQLEQEQRSRDSNLQVVVNKALEIEGQTLQQLDSIITIGGRQAYSSILLGKIDNQLLTLQITIPADNQQQAQTEAAGIIQTLRLE